MSIDVEVMLGVAAITKLCYIGRMLPRWKNPILYSAVLLAFLVYSGAVRPKAAPFRCLAASSDIRILRGSVKGNPTRVTSGTSYLVKFAPTQAVDINGNEYSCQGEVTAFISRETVEAYHPGALYTASRRSSAILCESGAVLEVQGTFGDGGTFGVRRAQALGWGRAPFSYIRHFRALCRLRFRALMAFWGSAGGLLLALISGIREYTEPQAREAFRYAGLSHVLALSGMHLSLVSSLALTAGAKTAGKRAAYLLQAAAVPFFVWFAGFSPSLLRAFLMSITLLCMSSCGVKSRDLLSVLCAVFLVHTMIVPSDASTAAFMLSYGALAGILTVGEASERVLSCALPPIICAPLCASIGAQVMTAPISLYLFGEFMPFGILASVAVSPLVVVFIYLGLAFIALSLIIPPLAVPSGVLLGAIYQVIKWIVVFFSRAPGVHML